MVEKFPNLDALLERAALLLRKGGGGSVLLSDPIVVKDGRRNRVVRCRVPSAESGFSSVMIKQIKEEGQRGFSDWAGLAFLSELPEAAGLVPRFCGGDIANRFFVMEDLGTGNPLQKFLTGTDSAAAQAALRSLASQMGRLHAVTLGKQEQFAAIRAALPENDGLGREREARQWLDNRIKIEAWFQVLDCVIPAGFEACLRFISERYRQPDDFLAFTHGDPAPSNNHFSDGCAWLLDFEYGGFRHALYDLTAWNILCPLPAGCVRDMSRCFREELAKAFPAARDEARFAEEWAVVCAYRALAMLSWIPPEILRENRPWADDWTMREAVFAALVRLREAAESCPRLAVVGEGAEILIAALRKRWPEYARLDEVLPRWPGLGGNRSTGNGSPATLPGRG